MQVYLSDAANKLQIQSISDLADRAPKKVLRIGCDRHMGSNVMVKLLCMELQLGYVVLQLALRTCSDACHRKQSSALDIRVAQLYDCILC